MVNRLRRCEICKQTFTTRSAYHPHKTRMHVKRFCRWCDHEEGRLYLLRDHVCKHHPWVNANGSPDVLYRSEDVPIERDTSHLFPTPQNYSPYYPEEIAQPLVTYTPTPRVLLSTPSRQVTSFWPIAPKLSSTETPTIVYTCLLVQLWRSHLHLLLSQPPSLQSYQWCPSGPLLLLH